MTLEVDHTALGSLQMTALAANGTEACMVFLGSTLLRAVWGGLPFQTYQFSG